MTEHSDMLALAERLESLATVCDLASQRVDDVDGLVTVRFSKDKWALAAVELRTMLAALSSNTGAAVDAKGEPVAPQTFTIEHDGFTGTKIGEYVTREGKRGAVLQQAGTRVVHVYGEKWLKPVEAPAPSQSDGVEPAAFRLGRWLAAALDDPNVCVEMKADINAWLEAGEPTPNQPGEAEKMREALMDATANLVAAASAYQKYAARHRSVGRATADPMFTTRVADFEKAAKRAQSAIRALPLPSDDGEVRSLYRHKKRGTTYRILNDNCTASSANVAQIDHEPMVVYQDIADGKVWVRPHAEFFDGRFEKMN